MTLSLCLIPPLTSLKSAVVGRNQVTTRTSSSIKCSDNNCEAKSFFLNPSDEQRILKKAIKEPVAFMGGMFAGLLRLDLNEDPLKEWVTRTVEASGFTDEDENIIPEEQLPQQIEIE